MREKIARAIADANGDNFDAIHRDKPHWIETGGMAAARFRDVNEPRRADYLAMADAVLDALMEPDEGMLDAAHNAPLPMVLLDSISARENLAFTAKWKAAVTAARSGG